jgi:hypothetical protein
MTWLGEELCAKNKDGRTPFARCLKDVVDVAAMGSPAPSGHRRRATGGPGYGKGDLPQLREMIPQC